ncbi:MAG: cadherin repeat domain-containing protein, partial [Planctomycetota bacterium]
MMRRLTALSLSTLAVLSLVSIASIGGCPVNITTGEPNAAGDNTQDQPPGTTGDQTPTGGDTGGDTGGGDQGGDQGGGGDTGDQSSDDTATVGPGTPVFIGDEQPNNGAPNVVNQGPVVADATFFVNENVPIGTVVGTINMVDPDEGDTLTVTVTGGSGAGKFNVDPASGEITTAVGLNHEVQDSYTLETLVTDSGGLTDTATLLINVNDLNEAPVIENQAFNVHENVAIGTHVYTIT